MTKVTDMTFYLYLSRLKKEITKKRIFDAFLVSVRRKFVLRGLESHEEFLYYKSIILSSSGVACTRKTYLWLKRNPDFSRCAMLLNWQFS